MMSEIIIIVAIGIYFIVGILTLLYLYTNYNWGYAYNLIMDDEQIRIKGTSVTLRIENHVVELKYANNCWNYKIDSDKERGLILGEKIKLGSENRFFSVEREIEKRGFQPAFLVGIVIFICSLIIIAVVSFRFFTEHVEEQSIQANPQKYEDEATDDYFDNEQGEDIVEKADEKDDVLEHYNDRKYNLALVEMMNSPQKDKYNEIIDDCEKKARRLLADTVSADTLYSMAITDKELICTGNTQYGQSNLNVADLVSISANGYYTIGLYSNGNVQIAGNIPWYNKLEHYNWNNVLQVSSAYDYVVVLFEDGTVDFRGYEKSDYYEGVIDFSEWKDIVYIDSGYHLTAGVDIDGKVYVEGNNEEKIQQEIDSDPNKWSDICAVAVGGDDNHENGFVIGLKSNGTIVTAGAVDDGLKEAEQWKQITMISAADYHLIALDENKKIHATMKKTEKNRKKDLACCELEEWNDYDIVNIEAGNGISIGIDSNGKAYYRGYDYQNQIPKEAGLWTEVLVYHEWKSME
jgi:alpha-tubulin suppressor-like RCC1 family protein